jgi:hypothetical protein
MSLFQFASLLIVFRAFVGDGPYLGARLKRTEKPRGDRRRARRYVVRRPGVDFSTESAEDGVTLPTLNLVTLLKNVSIVPVASCDS